jgi:hypothetical protein
MTHKRKAIPATATTAKMIRSNDTKATAILTFSGIGDYTP